ncbi:tetrapyrrole methylase family protein / MazG family protein [Ruminococcus sp. YE71]|uniref:MazG family protein n=1 Tax=unclassified Ruminococcus TaxID=2608920 RepID=UPI0008906679|nr:MULTISPECIES: MazG family protein [unclassified Ruminococcus]SDA18570.1 tetrapyrrole methylase family protein / MazG family protein [Ruminococcus sp. YE78]SFW29687.1 tetrapyrrole methylase family protein / MazG family protein [Ruminococcus sp. YE71]
MTDSEFEQRAAALLAKTEYGLTDLAEIVTLLRSERGCPWDKVQTHETIRRDFLEETYEVLEAIDCASPEMLREELGDVLLQVFFHTDIERERGTFTLDDVADEVCKKLILRHPHVFGDVKADTVDKVLSNWDAIKKDEKQQETFADTLKSVPKVFPSAMRAQKLGKRASRAGIELASADDANELAKQLIDRGETAKAMLVLANAVRLRGGDAEEELARACDSFTERFEELESSGRTLTEVAAAELYDY